MGLEEKNQYIEQYIKNVSAQVNSQYEIELIDNDKIFRILTMFKDSSDDLEIVIFKINKLVQQVIDKYLEQLRQVETIINSVKTFNVDEIDTNLNVNNQGMYLSSCMIYALSLINASSIAEINEWIDKIPNLYMVSPIQSMDYSSEQIELIKRKLFDMLQDSMISTDVVKEINRADREQAMRFALHKKLSGLTLSLEDEIKLGDLGLNQGIPALYRQVENICIAKYGKEKGSIISNKIVNYFTADTENFNSATYNQMQSLNEKIKSNIQKCNLSGGDFQLVICSLNYSNTVNDLGNGKFQYNYKTSEMGQELAERLGASYRLRSMINRNAADDMVLIGYSKDDKEVIMQILRDSLASSLQSFNSNIKPDQKNRTFELFNELVEIKKNDRDYKCVFEERFGISIKDLIREVIAPNRQLIQELKSKNVDFMYNETLLQESQEKRDKVMETMVELQKFAPGLINVWADQSHTFSSDYSKEKIEQLKNVAEFDKKMSETIFKKDEKNSIISFTDKNEFKVKIECSEKDLYLSQSEVRNMRQNGMSKQDILKYKQGLENTYNKIFRLVPFARKCEWTVLDNISGNYYQHEMSTNKESYIGKYTKISDMAKKDNSQRINNDRNDFKKWKNAVKQIKQQQLLEHKMQLQQHQAITNQLVNSGPKLTMKKLNNTSTGFTNALLLTFVTVFTGGIVAIIIYFIVK